MSENIERALGRLEAQVSALRASVSRVEGTMRRIVDDHDERLRIVEKDVHTAKKVGGLAGAALGGLVSALAAIWSALSR